jgi:hypothetical protein
MIQVLGAGNPALRDYALGHPHLPRVVVLAAGRFVVLDPGLHQRPQKLRR